MPSWYLGRNPDHRVIVAGYSEDFAERFSRRNRDKLQRWGQDLFGVQIGSVFGNKFEKKAQFLGGAILIALGVKILLEHLGIL